MTVIPFTAIHAVYVGLDRTEVASLILFAVAISVIGVHVGIASLRVQTRPLAMWLQDTHGSAGRVEARRCPSRVLPLSGR